ncbi:MAG: L-histidine N(alpha)-methyltransferase [Glaciimonas sp.]|nr:L-histidine N(alpha)-methyltransferase [Glaciimonas sp.]
MPLSQRLSLPTLRATGADLVHNSAATTEAIRVELRSGLMATPAFTSPKYLYNALGSRLFEAICLVPEYYPTRTEAAIFDENLAQIAQAVGPGSTLIDLGAGNCAKAVRLFPALLPRQYVPIDISADFLAQALAPIRQCFPTVEMTGIGLDFSSSLDLPATVRHEKRVFFYPGSSIGNFVPAQAAAFLGRIRAACGADGALLIGVDLIKDHAILDAAYDDALGVTAAFNLNLLHHLNGLLETDFAVQDWLHRAFYNPQQSRVEMHLEARQALTVRWPGGQRRFAQGERIHTENSYKYTPQSFAALLGAAGFDAIQTWTDDCGWFAVMHARAA